MLLPAHQLGLAQLQAHCAASADAADPATFPTTLGQLRADVEADLFPALLDAMAGSDAVCIREMRERLATQHDALALQWQRLQDLPARALLSAQCRDLVEFETRELLPMAERLLDDQVLADLRASMAARRGADRP